MQPGEVPYEAVNQAGTFTRKQAYAEGWTRRQVRRRLQAGRWKGVAGAALAAAQTEVGPRQLAFAVLLTWPDAIPSHQLAGALHNLPVDPQGTGMAIVPLTQSRRAQGLRAHRLELAADEIGLVAGIPVTTPSRTSLDLLRALTWHEARSLWAWLVTRRLLGVPDLESEVTRGQGRPGSAQLRRLVAASASGALSAAEDLLHALLRAAAITGWRANVPIQVGGRVVAVADVLFAAERLVVEVDGFSTHSGRRAFQHDRSTQNTLVTAGYTVLRFTWADLVERPGQVISSVRAALDFCAQTSVGR